MIRHIEGFDLFEFAASGLPYLINSGIFAQGSMIAGQSPGQSWFIFNTGFGQAEYLKILDVQPIWIVNIWFRPLTTPNIIQVWRNSTFYRIQDVTGTLFDLHQQTDGTVLFRGSGGVTLATLGPFPVGDWAALQVKVTATAWTVKVNGVTVATGAPAVWRQPDRFMHRWDASSGLNLDNYVICDGQGTANNDFLPYPWRVDSMYPFATASNAWGIHLKPDALQCVYDHPAPSVTVPDGDNGYIKPTAIAQRSLYQMNASPCVGRVLGLALSVVAKPTTGSPTVQLIVEQNAVTSLAQPTLATRAVQLPGLPELDDYFTYLGISETQPVDGSRWTDGAIGRANWGVESDSADVHVTQIFIQKVTTLAPTLSYDCGGAGSYAF